MEIERGTLIEVGVSVVGVGFFVAAVIWIGATNGGRGLIGEGGALALVGAIVGFILVMTAIGYWLSGRA